MNVETLLSFFRGVARIWRFFRGVFGRAPSSDPPRVEPDRGASPPAPSAPAGWPRLDPREFGTRLKAEVMNPRYANQDDPTWSGGRRTYCNFFTREVCSWFGWKNFESADRDQAGEITRYMRSHPATWRMVGTVEAASLASRGHLVVAGQEHPTPPPTGHVCIVAPGDPVYSNKWGINVPIVANVGGSNWYGKGLNHAFKERPQLFLYTGVEA